MGKLVVGLTGEIGCGKSFVAEKLIEKLTTEKISVHHLDLDKIAKDIRDNDEKVKGEVATIFKSNDPKVIREMVLNEPDKYFDELNGVMIPALSYRVIDMINKISSGIVIMNGALIIEFGFLNFCDYRTVIVVSDPTIQLENLEKRGYNLKQMNAMVKSQKSDTLKILYARQYTQLYKKGYVEVIHNYQTDLDKQLNTLVDVFKFEYKKV